MKFTKLLVSTFLAVIFFVPVRIKADSVVSETFGFLKTVFFVGCVGGIVHGILKHSCDENKTITDIEKTLNNTKNLTKEFCNKFIEATITTIEMVGGVCSELSQKVCSHITNGSK